MDLKKVVEGDKRGELAKAAIGPNQEHVRNATIAIVFTAVYERTTWKYKHLCMKNERERAI